MWTSQPERRPRRVRRDLWERAQRLKYRPPEEALVRASRALAFADPVMKVLRLDRSGRLFIADDGQRTGVVRSTGSFYVWTTTRWIITHDDVPKAVTVPYSETQSIFVSPDEPTVIEIGLVDGRKYRLGFKNLDASAFASEIQALLEAWRRQADD